MKDSEIITGTSAVNDDGHVIIFCADPGFLYERCELEGREIRLISEARGAIESRTYGPLACDALRSGAPVFIQSIQPDGSAADLYQLEH